MVQRGKSAARDVPAYGLSTAIVLAVAGGCGPMTTRVPVRLLLPTPAGQLGIRAPLPVHAAVLITDELTQTAHQRQRHSVLFEITAGAAVESAAVETFSEVFQSITVVRAPRIARDYDITIVPEITDLDPQYEWDPHNKVACEMTLRLSCLDRQGDSVWVKSATCSDQALTRPTVQAVGSVCGAALVLAMRQLAAELATDAAFSRYVASNSPPGLPAQRGQRPESSAAPYALENRRSAALVDFRGLAITQAEATILSDRLRVELARTGRFEMIERERMTELLAEQGFQQSGLCDTERCYLEVGRLVGAEVIVAGTVGKLGRTYSVNARMIEVETGRIAAQASYDCPCEIDQLLGAMAIIAERLAAP